MSAQESLLSSEMVARLSRLSLVARKLPRARLRGLRTLRSRGAGIEAIDLRAYTSGDDPRRIAWHAYARLERLLVRVMASEAPLRMALILDTSASMGFGRPSKLLQGSRVAAGLAAVALGQEDRIALITTSSESKGVLRATGGAGAMGRLLTALDSLEAAGETHLASAAPAATAALGGRGLCVLLSDLLDAAGVESAVGALRAQGHEVALIEVLTPFEIEPPPLDGYVLEDEESGELLELPAHGVVRRYKEALARHRAAVRDVARKAGASVLSVSTSESFDDVMMRAIDTGFVRAGGIR